MPKNIREIDIFGRNGGEEITMVLPEVDVTEPQDVAERLRQVIVQRPFDAVAVILDFNISLDLADLNPSNTAFASILKRADEALYAFKRAGRSKVVQI